MGYNKVECRYRFIKFGSDGILSMPDRIGWLVNAMNASVTFVKVILRSNHTNRISHPYIIL
jgi:hypothetical protein